MPKRTPTTRGRKAATPTQAAPPPAKKHRKKKEKDANPDAAPAPAAAPAAPDAPAAAAAPAAAPAAPDAPAAAPARARKAKAPLEPPPKFCPPRKAAADGQRALTVLSWNVDGIRATGRREMLSKLVAEHAPDVLAIQETKLQEKDEEGWADAVIGYTPHFSSSGPPAKKGAHSRMPQRAFPLIRRTKGYSGTAVWLRDQTSMPGVTFGIHPERHLHEGRAITVEYPELFVVNLCAPPPPQPAQPPPLAHGHAQTCRTVVRSSSGSTTG